MITSKGFTGRGSVNLKGGGSWQQEDPIEGGSSLAQLVFSPVQSLHANGCEVPTQR